MIDAIVGLVAMLRTHGITVGPDRTVVAARALRHIDLADRTATLRALRIALVGHRHDEPVFDAIVSRWFDGELISESSPDDHDDGRAPRSPTIAAELALDTERRLHEAVYVDDPSERFGVTTEREGDTRDGATASGVVVDPGGERVAAAVDAATAVGRVTADDGRSTIRSTRHADGSIELPGEGDGPESTSGAPEMGVAEIQALRALLADERRRRLVGAATDVPTPLRLSPTRMLTNPFDAAEQRTLEHIVGLMVPQLVGSPGWRHRRGREGSIDLRRVLRASSTTGGIPVVLSRHRPSTTRARVVVLLDSSLSVRPSARLMLHLAHRIRSRLGRVRVLAFIDHCVDVTDVIRHTDLATALGRLLDDEPGGPLDPARSSDYGAALRSMWARYATLLRPDTTVIILGDGRSNGRDPDADLVGELTERCRRTIWLTPEPGGAWGFGNGEMAAYAGAVDVAWTVRSLDDLLELARSGLITPPRLGTRPTHGATR